MQSLPTLTVCTLYAGIIHLVLFHNSVRINGLDGLPQLTRASVISIVTVTYHNFNITVFLAYLSCLLLVASTIVLSNQIRRIDSNQFSGVNRTEIIFSESECTTRVKICCMKLQYVIFLLILTLLRQALTSINPALALYLAVLVNISAWSIKRTPKNLNKLPPIIGQCK